MTAVLLFGYGLAAAAAALVLVAGFRRRANCVLTRLAVAAGEIKAVPRGRSGRGAPPLRTAVLALVLVACFLLVPPAAPMVAAGAWLAPRLARRRTARAADRSVVEALPDTVDLFMLAAAAGGNVANAVDAVAPRAPPPLGAALAGVHAMVEQGHRLADALESLPARAGEPVRPLVTVLLSSVRYGAPLLPSLERLAGDVRLDRRRRAEEAARRVPVQLLFPLVLFVLPAFALLTVVPLLAGALDDLRL